MGSNLTNMPITGLILVIDTAHNRMMNFERTRQNLLKLSSGIGMHFHFDVQSLTVLKSLTMPTLRQNLPAECLRVNHNLYLRPPV